MKIRKEHYTILENAIRKTHDNLLLNHETHYKNYLNFGHSNKRVAWDLLNLANMTQFVCDTLYKYLNDTHIDTAVLDIWKKISGRLA